MMTASEMFKQWFSNSTSSRLSSGLKGLAVVLSTLCAIGSTPMIEHLAGEVVDATVRGSYWTLRVVDQGRNGIAKVLSRAGDRIAAAWQKADRDWNTAETTRGLEIDLKSEKTDLESDKRVATRMVRSAVSEAAGSRGREGLGFAEAISQEDVRIRTTGREVQILIGK